MAKLSDKRLQGEICHFPKALNRLQAQDCGCVQNLSCAEESCIPLLHQYME